MGELQRIKKGWKMQFGNVLWVSFGGLKSFGGKEMLNISNIGYGYCA